MEDAPPAPTISPAITSAGSIADYVDATTIIAKPGGLDRTGNMIMEMNNQMLQTGTTWTRGTEPGDALPMVMGPSPAICQESVGTPLVSHSSSTQASQTSPSPRPTSYAQVTTRMTSHSTSSFPLNFAETRRQQRAQLLRRAALGTISNNIIQTVMAQIATNSLSV